MNIDGCIKKIDKYLTKDNVQPCIVDVQTTADLSAVVTHYNVGTYKFIDVAEYCNNDEFPRIDALIDVLAHQECATFVTGMSSFLKLKGEQYLRDTLKNILSMTVKTHIVVLTVRSGKHLNYGDPRLANRITIVDGKPNIKQNLIFTAKTMPVPRAAQKVSGLHSVAESIEKDFVGDIYVITDKEKKSFPYSLFSITDLNRPYSALCLLDSSTESLGETIGTDEQWSYALTLFKSNDGWADVIDREFANHNALDLAINNYIHFTSNQKWLFFVGTKLFGCANNWVLNYAANNASTVRDFIKCIYRSILSVAHTDKKFRMYYNQRKIVLDQLGNPINEVVDFCKVVISKGQNALHYLTDNSQKERELVFSLLDKYGSDYTKEQLIKILEDVYPDLCAYLSDYRFKNTLLDNYFSQYKYQKVINKLLPEFVDIVAEQAEKREYNLILEPRSSIVESIDKRDAQLYFMDAMGVEYLGFIMTVCKEMGVSAKIRVCRSELPSLTCENKEFLIAFENGEHPIVSIKDLDEIKHHGKGDYDYQQTKLPIYLSRELEIIRDVLNKIRSKLMDGTIKKAVMIADHGASRLAVLNESENIWEMAEKGVHSGRCCLKSDVDQQPSYATDSGEYWALANYDRFKGGRKANVEVHGGATLEEVTVPVIELSYMDTNIEVFIMATDDNNATLDTSATITVSFRKKARIKIFSTSQLDNVSVKINDKFYDAIEEGDNYYSVEMADIKKPNTYSLEVYANDTLVAGDLTLIVKSEGMGSNNKGIL